MNICLLLSLLLASPAQAVAPVGTPNLSGSWLFDRAQSDDVRARLEEAVGPDVTVGGDAKEFQRVWIRGWLLGVVEDSANRILTIEQTDHEFKSGLGDEVSLFYFGRKGTSRGPNGGNLATSVLWKDGALLTEEKADKDKGRIANSYVPSADGRSMVVTFRLEHRSLRKPLEIRLAFTRQKP